MLKTQQRSKSFYWRNNKITLSSSDDKGMQSIDSMETEAYGTSKFLVSEKWGLNVAI